MFSLTWELRGTVYTNLSLPFNYFNRFIFCFIMWNLGTNKNVSVTFIYARFITQLKIVFDWETSFTLSFIYLMGVPCIKIIPSCRISWNTYKSQSVKKDLYAHSLNCFQHFYFWKITKKSHKSSFHEQKASNLLKWYSIFCYNKSYLIFSFELKISLPRTESLKTCVEDINGALYFIGFRTLEEIQSLLSDSTNATWIIKIYFGKHKELTI